MLGTYASAGLVCAGALLLGQAVLRLCGATRWSWLSAPVGLAALILVAIPSLHLPGRAGTVAVALGTLIVASAVWLLRAPAHRPPPLGLLAGGPVALLTAVPFVSAGHAGTLGWSFNNDMAAHLLLADGYRSDLVERFNPLLPDYPLGPHALAAVVAQALGVGVDEAFAGVTIAGAVLLGWTALAALRRPRRWAPLLVAPVVGMPYLIAAYYGQGAFKELLEAVLVVGFAVLLAAQPRLGRLRRWIPAALLVAGTLSVYSFLGAIWPLAFLGVWLAGLAVRRLAATRGSARALWADARAALAPAALGAVVLLLVVVPQLPRLASFVSNRTGQNGTFIAKEDLGILVRPLPFWEAFGTWGNSDFRLPAPDHLTNRLWILFVVALVVLGAVWAIRRGEWMLVGAAAAAAAIWAMSDRTQSPYVAAKALVLLTPLLMIVRGPGARRGCTPRPLGAALVVAGRARAGGGARAARRRLELGNAAREPSRSDRPPARAAGAPAGAPPSADALPRQRRLPALGAGRDSGDGSRDRLPGAADARGEAVDVRPQLRPRLARQRDVEPLRVGDRSARRARQRAAVAAAGGASDAQLRPVPADGQDPPHGRPARTRR